MDTRDTQLDLRAAASSQACESQGGMGSLAFKGRYIPLVQKQLPCNWHVG